ncbi:nucleoside triphosphate pyrophosphohydrolase [Phenylobacterium sp.]|uniref:nucleoside triphosphate pyrophosphohydrolase n=1 Tax=Phenylobacterium sp. TaxID=1871053 RepID=UPI002730D196|nr:nucleoside triphosphate pyrophosphohydrolase [Phenylobacterium sp.]MDP1599532.1 nucleoside triphosphate pyrophosphohydrolase [Phenylobacterium sp.]
MRFRVQKLIRDRLPAIMRAQGLQVFDRRLNAAEFIAALKDKLVEEAQEVGAATGRADLIDELADVMEVIAALAEASGVTPGEIEARRRAKRAERGGFDERVFNAAVEARDGLPAAEYYLARPMQYPRED